MTIIADRFRNTFVLRAKARLLLWTFTVLAIAPNIVQAHHSFAMFDLQKLVTLNGTMKEVQWTNPHVWIWIVVPIKDGDPEVWAIEGGGPSMFAQMKLAKADLASGAKVTMVIHPLKNGQKGGMFLTITLPDGRTAGSLATPIDILKDKKLIDPSVTH